MVLMMGLLEGYYIPHYLWHYSPKNFEERVSLKESIFLFFRINTGVHVHVHTQIQCMYMYMYVDICTVEY